MSSDNSKKNETNNTKKEYDFGKLVKYNLEEIESEVLSDSVYLDVFAGSDPLFKENVQSVNPILDNVLNLKTVSFNYKNSTFPEQQFPIGEQIGFMADQVEEMFPHLVKHDENGKKFVNYAMLTPILTKSIQDLNSKVEKQEKLINDLISELKTLRG